MLQQQQENRVKKVLDKFLKDNYLFIKIHGGQYQMRGLPDFLILTPGMIFWLEHKRDKNDTPSALQRHLVENVLPKFNIVSGYIIDDFVYKSWDKEICFEFEFMVKHFNKEYIDV